MAKIVQKFGGTSLADLEHIRQAAQIVVNNANQGHELVTVVSAMGNTTDNLIALAEKMSASPAARELDMLLNTGEQQTVALMTMAIQELGCPARAFTGGQAGIITESKFGSAKIEEIRPAQLEASMNRGEIPVIAGFQGIAGNQDLTTLGRGGSDTTAVAIANALGAQRCDIYTDVEGVYTTDPHLVGSAGKLPSISYEEMYEMAITGARVINDRAVVMAKEGQLPVRVRSTFKPADQGTLITDQMHVPEYAVCGVTLDLNQVWYSWQMSVSTDQEKKLDNIASLFLRLSELNITADMIMLLAREDEPIQELVFTTESSAKKKVQSIIQSTRMSQESNLLIDEQLARISVISRRLNGRPEIVASVFDALNQIDIPVQMVATSDLRFSLLTPKPYAEKAVHLIHEHFDLWGNTRVVTYFSKDIF